MVFLFLVTAGLCLLITIGGWSRLEGGGAVCLFYTALFLLFAFLVARWNRGVLPVAAALAIILVIFCALATPTWFARAKDGFSQPLFPEELLGLLTLLTVLISVIVIGVSLIAFNQEWHVEEERPIGGIVPPDEGPEPPPEAPSDQPAPA
jgi:hypothetical protein